MQEDDPVHGSPVEEDDPVHGNPHVEGDQVQVDDDDAAIGDVIDDFPEPDIEFDEMVNYFFIKKNYTYIYIYIYISK